MLHNIHFKEDFRCWWKGESIEFHPGINLLVGDQGCGKSSLLDAIRAMCGDKKAPIGLKEKITYIADPITTIGFDFEKDNLRTLGHLDYGNIGPQLAAKKSSHGEFTNYVLTYLTQIENTLIYLDEPDQALSIRSIKKLINMMQLATNKGCQIIAAVHHPYIIEAFPEVYSCEHRIWMPSNEFIQKHLS
jgi:predicted ATPase